MIPQTIHYCWFGNSPKPALAKKCIKSWKRHCRGYEIIEWNEENYDISAAPLYVRQAYEAKKWAFVTDYVRLDVVYQNGGIYLDTDVEVIRNLDRFLSNKAFFGLENAQYVATGLGFGAERGSPILAEMMADYQEIPFVLPDGSYDQTPCPVRNTEVLLCHGFKQDGTEQMLDGEEIHIYPQDFFCPRSYSTGTLRRTKNTHTVHWYSASWLSEEIRRKDQKYRRKVRRYIRHAQYKKLLCNIMGETMGETVYQKLKNLKSALRRTNR